MDVNGAGGRDSKSSYVQSQVEAREKDLQEKTKAAKKQLKVCTIPGYAQNDERLKGQAMVLDGIAIPSISILNNWTWVPCRLSKTNGTKRHGTRVQLFKIEREGAWTEAIKASAFNLPRFTLPARGT